MLYSSPYSKPNFVPTSMHQDNIGEIDVPFTVPHKTYPAPYSSLMCNSDKTFIAMFSAGKPDFLLFNVPKNTIQLMTTENNAIAGISFVNQKLAISYEDKLEIFNIECLKFENAESSVAIIKPPFVLGEKPAHKTVQIKCLKTITLSLENSLVLKDTLCVFPLKETQLLYLFHKTFAVYGKNLHLKNDRSFEKFSLVNDNCLIVYLSEGIEIYKLNEGLVYEGRYEDICHYKCLEEPVYTEYNSKKIKKCKDERFESDVYQTRPYYNVRENKIYKLQNEKIVGPDLNLYLEDLDNFHPTEFQNQDNSILLFDAKLGDLRVYSKNLKKCILNVLSDKWICFDEDLFSIHSGNFEVYKIQNQYKAPFELITDSILYYEEEDELDWSDTNYHDLKTPDNDK